MRSLKKNLIAEVARYPDAELYFFDESRFGTHSKVGHGWFKTGQRTQIDISLGFKNFYVYSAVASKTGNAFHLIMPNVDTQCMNTFLSEFSMFLENKKAIIVLDGASWHKSHSLKLPSNVRLVYLPAYSPELNPVEKLWEYIKNHTIKNRIYQCLKELEQRVGNFIAELSNSQIMETCKCSYMLN